MFSALWLLGLLALVNDTAHAADAVCTDPDYSLFINSLDQDVCTIAKRLLFGCDDTPRDASIEALESGYYYSSAPVLNECACNTVFYAIFSACAFCQGGAGSISDWGPYHAECNETFTTYPRAIPTETRIQSWAYIPLTVNGTVDEQQVLADYAEGGFEEFGAPTSAAPSSTASSTSTSTSTSSTSILSTTSTASSSSTTDPSASASSGQNNGGEDSSDSSSTNVGAIAGGVVGGVVALVAAILAILFYFRRRKRHVADKEAFANTTTNYGPPTTLAPSASVPSHSLAPSPPPMSSFSSGSHAHGLSEYPYDLSLLSQSSDPTASSQQSPVRNTHVSGVPSSYTAQPSPNGHVQRFSASNGSRYPEAM